MTRSLKRIVRSRPSRLLRMRLILSALAALTLALGAVACGSDDEEEGGGGGGGSSSGNLIESDPANAKTSLTVGSKNFDEQYILGEILSLIHI